MLFFLQFENDFHFQIIKNRELFLESVYRTGQREILAECFARNKEKMLTAADITEDLLKNGQRISVATIYRNLESLEKQGIIHKFMAEDGKKAMWQYVGAQSKCTEHYHLKCQGCGKVIHLECRFADDFDSHILKEHNFTMNREHTLLYGICSQCSQGV